MANKTIPQLDPVVTAAQSDKFIVRQSGDFEDKHADMSVMQLALQITESQITDLQSYLTVEANDLTAAVTWANIPDANVPESAVTQHEAALTITESQISDLQAYLLAEVNDLSAAVTWANIPDANVPETAVTQHEAALTITESQISDLAHTVGVSGLGVWKYRTETTAPPAAGQIRFNNANVSLATEFYLHETNEGGVDVSTFIELLLQDGSALFIQDKTDAGNSILIEISSSTDNGVYRTYGIQSVTEQGTEPGQNDDVILLTTGLASAGGVTEVNDLTASVTWDDIPDANVPQSAVTQHVGAIDHDSLLNFAAGEHFTQAAISITESQVSDLQAYLLDITGENIADLADVTQVTPTQFHAIARNAANTGWESRLLVEADISDLGHTAEVNDLSAAVTWVNIPDANVPETAVTQHEAALTITESQISDLGAYLLDITGESLADLSDVVSAAITNRFVLAGNGTTGYVGRLLVEADISDLGAYLTTEVNDLSAAVTWANIPDANVPASAVTQHVGSIDHDQLLNFAAGEHFTQAAISITESQVSDLQAYLLDITGENIADLADVTQVTPTQFHVIARNAGNTGWESRLLVEADISDLGHTSEVNDLSAAVTWVNIPDANVPASAVTQHVASIDHDQLLNFAANEHFTQAAISITESQISDLGAYLENIVEDTTPQLGADLDTNGFNITNLDTTLLGLLIAAGSDGSGIGGTLTLRAGASGGSGVKGGSVLIEATNGAGGGAEGGDITLTAGNASGSGDDGGDFLAMAGAGVGGGGTGGNATVEAGTHNGGGIGGIASLIGGEGNNGTGIGGAAKVIGGLGGTNGGPGGDAEIIGGAGVTAGSDGAGGDVVITGGVGAGVAADGEIRLAVVGATNIVFDPTSGRLEQGAETFAYLSEITGDVNKVGTPANNQLGVWTGDGTIEGAADLTWDGTTFATTGAGDRINTGNGSAGGPGYGFVSETNTGMYRQAAGVLGFSILGTARFFMPATSFHANILNGPRMMYEGATDTNPTFIPNLADDTSGVGGVSGTVALIGSGVTLAKTVAAASGGLQANNASTGGGLERVLTTSDLPAAPTANDAVQARRTTALTLTTSYVDVTMDATDVETDAAVIEHDNTNTDDIDIKVTGTYEISYDVDVETAAASGSLLITMDGRVRLNDAGTGIAGSDARCGSARDTSLDGEHFQNHLSCSFIVNLTATDFITLQLRKTELAGAGSGQFDSIRQSLKVKRLK